MKSTLILILETAEPLHSVDAFIRGLQSSKMLNTHDNKEGDMIAVDLLEAILDEGA